MTWGVLYLLHADVAKLLMCWLVVPALMWFGLLPTISAFRAYWDE